MEKILKIKEFEDRNVGHFCGYDGYEITTTDRKIELAISNEQC